MYAVRDRPSLIGCGAGRLRLAVPQAVSDWLICRPSERSPKDIDLIYCRLKDLKAFEKFHPILLQQIAYYSYYEDLEDGITRE